MTASSSNATYQHNTSTRTLQARGKQPVIRSRAWPPLEHSSRALHKRKGMKDNSPKPSHSVTHQKKWGGGLGSKQDSTSKNEKRAHPVQQTIPWILWQLSNWFQTSTYVGLNLGTQASWFCIIWQKTALTQGQRKELTNTSTRVGQPLPPSSCKRCFSSH